MRLGEKQELFMRLLPRLIDKAHELGFDVRGGELLRFEQQARWNAEHCRRCKMPRNHTFHRNNGHTFTPIGIVNSLHRQKLAIDLILFKAGEPCWSSSQYQELGSWWKQQHELCRWGGDFRSPDGGHFSLTHKGRQ
jgi:hypothetical protein